MPHAGRPAEFSLVAAAADRFVPLLCENSADVGFVKWSAFNFGTFFLLQFEIQLQILGFDFFFELDFLLKVVVV